MRETKQATKYQNENPCKIIQKDEAGGQEYKNDRKYRNAVRITHGKLLCTEFHNGI